MSYSRRQLYALGETFGESATHHEVGGKIIYGSGGGGAPETKTGSTDIPDWVKPYAEEGLGKAQALTSTPYQSYGGERVAQFTPLQKTAFDRADNQQVAGQIGTGTGLASLAGSSSFNDPGTAGSFMSPYMQNVVAMQQRDAQRQADIAGTQRGAQAVRAGAFGGSRQAIMDAEAGRNLSQQMGDIQTTGLQSAFDRAQQQFNQEQSTRLNAAGQLGQLGQQQFGQEMGITGQQFGFGQQQRQATQDILNTRYQDFLDKQRAPYDQLSFMSGILRGTPMGQTQVSTAPGASTASQLIGLGTAAAGAYGAYKGAAGGEIPSYAAGGIANLKSQPEMAAAARGMDDQQVAETAGMAGIAGLTAGDEQRRRNELRMAAEGQKAPASMTKITSVLSQMSDAELQQYAKMHKSDPYTMALVVSESNRRKEGGMPSQEQPKVVDQQIAGMALPEEQGIAQLPVGNMEFAGGGIIAFQNRGEVPDPEDALERQRAEDRKKIQGAYETGLISAEEFGRALADIGTLPVRGIAGALDTAVVRPLRAAGADIGYMSPYLVPEGSDPESMTPFYDQMRSPSPDQSGIAAREAPAAGAPRGRGVGFTDPRLSQSGINQSVAALQSAEPQRKALADAGAGEKKQPGPPGIASGLGYLKQLEAERDRQIAAQAEIDRLRAADVATTRGELTEEEKRAAEFGSEREKRLKAQEQKLAGSEKQNFNMTLIEAGLAMMAGDSPNAFKNLAEGAARGLKGYQGRLQTLQDSREKLDESMARLAEIREEKVSAVGARKRELNAMERGILTESKAAQEKIASAFAGDKIKFTKDQANKASDRAFDVWQIKQRGDQNSLAMHRLNLSRLNGRRVLLQGQLAQASRDGLDDEVARLRSELAGVDRALAGSSETASAPESGGKVLNFADI